MSYKIIITKSEQQKSEKDGDWDVVDKRPWTKKEIADAAPYAGEAHFLQNTPLKEVREYTPRREVITTVDVKILEQTVETIDLAAVIKAINNL